MVLLWPSLFLDHFRFGTKPVKQLQGPLKRFLDEA